MAWPIKPFPAEVKHLLEIVLRDSFSQNSHNTTALPDTAAKPEKENHTESTMDAALLRCSCRQKTSMLSWCKATAVVEK